MEERNQTNLPVVVGVVSKKKLDKEGMHSENSLQHIPENQRDAENSLRRGDMEETPNERLLPRILLTPSSRDDSNTDLSTTTGDLNSPLPYKDDINDMQPKLLNSYRLYIPANDMLGNELARRRSMGQSMQSIETIAPPPTSPHENKTKTQKGLAITVSCMYAMLIVTFGLIIYISDPWVSNPSAQIYSILLCSIGFVYTIFLLLDIGLYKSKVKKYEKEFLNDDQMLEETSGTFTPEDRTRDLFTPPEVPVPTFTPVKDGYRFNHGRHSGSFYLKLGAAVFALGHLVHSLLLILVQIANLIDDNISNDECVDFLQVALDIMFPIYCFLQLYFIFKYSNVIILRRQGLAHFAFMHLIGSSLCFWMSAIVRETVLGLSIYAHTKYDNNHTISLSIHGVSIQLHLDIGGLFNPNCTGNGVNDSIVEISPYLYPFSVEFNILIVAVYYIIWSNIGLNDHEDIHSDTEFTHGDDTNISRTANPNANNEFTSNIVIHADCHASNRGLFSGLILIVVIIAVLITGFIFCSVDDQFVRFGYFLNDSTKLGLHVIMLFGAVIAFIQMRKLDINNHPISVLDDVLLFICLPAFFVETLYSLTATIFLGNHLKSIDILVMLIQVLIQTPLIMDGLRRCSNSRKLRRTKPSREVIMFLLIANVGMWFFYTFSYKSPASLDERYAFYGKIIWTILGHTSLPLIMFYRFHSSVCFADIWDSAYKPGTEH